MANQYINIVFEKVCFPSYILSRYHLIVSKIINENRRYFYNFICVSDSLIINHKNS